MALMYGCSCRASRGKMCVQVCVWGGGEGSQQRLGMHQRLPGLSKQPKFSSWLISR